MLRGYLDHHRDTPRDWGLDTVAVRRYPRTGEGSSLRSVLPHLREEYARQHGHADLLREAADEQTGA